MSLFKKKASFSVFSLDRAKIPENILQIIEENVPRHAFKDIDDTLEESSVGWVSVFDMFDASFARTPFLIGDFVAISLRIDERKVPSAVLKKFIEKEERRVKQEQRLPRLGRSRKKEIKERVTTELVRKDNPSPTVIDVVWNLETHVIFFFSCNLNAKEVFEFFFHHTFGIEVTQEQPIEDQNETGVDFLTWLWWKSETGQRLTIGENDIVDTSIGGKIRLSTDQESIACNCPNSELPEARESLLHGKAIEQAALEIWRNDFKWSCSFSPLPFEFRSVTLPTTAPAEGKDDEDGFILERISLHSQLLETVNHIIRIFLASCLDDKSTLEEWVLAKGVQDDD